MTEGWVDYLTGPYGFAFAFAAGILSFLSPCVLPLVPAYLAHLTGTTATLDAGRSERRETVTHAATFVLGFTLVFTFIGASVGLLGAVVSADSSYAVRDQIPLLAKIGGVFLIVMGLNLIGVIKIPFLYRTYTLETATASVPAGVERRRHHRDRRRLAVGRPRLREVARCRRGVRRRLDAVHRPRPRRDPHALGHPARRSRRARTCCSSTRSASASRSSSPASPSSRSRRSCDASAA